MMRCIALIVFALGAFDDALGQCVFDPVTGQRVCGVAPGQSLSRTVPALNLRPSGIDNSAYCRISVADGSTGSGTLIGCDEQTGLVLTCAHLFDTSADGITVSFPNGERFAARLLDRDRAHDLAALLIRRPNVAPRVVSDTEPLQILTACGFGPNGEFRCVEGAALGEVKANGATYPSQTIRGAVRPGDSGGGVLDAQGRVIGVIWGQRDGVTYTTCGKPVREFLKRVCRPNSGSDTPAHAPQIDWSAWSAEIESRIRALDAKKQDKGDYLQPGDLNGYARATDVPRIDTAEFSRREEVNEKMSALSSRFESVRSHVDSVREAVHQATTGRVGVFEGLSWGKLAAGALGLSGPLAAAVVVAGGLAGRRLKSIKERGSRSEVDQTRSSLLNTHPSPIAVDSPPPPQQTVPETHFVSVEKASFAKAHQWASEHVARKYPGATEVLQAQDSLIKQYLAAK
jgi:hypothetical protein